jgi:hypothetical protein
MRGGTYVTIKKIDEDRYRRYIGVRREADGLGACKRAFGSGFTVAYAD